MSALKKYCAAMLFFTKKNAREGEKKFPGKTKKTTSNLITGW